MTTIAISNINSVHDLPDGYLVTGKEKKYEIPETARVHIAVWHSKKTKKNWVLFTQEGKRQTTLLEMIKRIKNKGEDVEISVQVQEGFLKALYERSDKEFVESKENREQSDSHVIQRFHTIMSQVLKEKASDIHIEKRQEQACIKIRKNGEMVFLEGYETMSPTEATELCTVIYNVLAESDSKEVAFNDTLIQQGAIKILVQVDKESIETKLRFQSVTAYPNGLDVVMRVLPVGRNEKYESLEKLGYESSQIKMILECVSKVVGTVVIAGVTGSGKSTTLKNLLMWINEKREFSEKIFTVEDPPEYIIPHVTQIPVARRKDDTKEGRKPFEDAIKACMRADPDIIMVGEIRDNATGDLLKKAVQSGHRVLTTTHAPSALGVVERFLDFGLSAATLSSQEFFAGLIYQRLLGNLCQSCSTPLNDIISKTSAPKHLLDIRKRIEKALKDSEEESIDKYLGNVRIRGKGCSKCQKGVTGRTVCAEVVKPDISILEEFRNSRTLGALRYLREKVADKSITNRNMVGKSAMAHAVAKMLNGELDPVEVENSFGLISIDEIRGLSELHINEYGEDNNDDYIF